MTGATFPREARLVSPIDFTRALKTRPHRGKFLWIYRLDPTPQVGEMSAAGKENLAQDSAGAPGRALASPEREKTAAPFIANAYRGPQLGMMIGKRNAKTAVLRNAIKRRVREQFRLRAAKLPARAYVVRLFATASKVTIPLIVDEWVKLLDLDISKNASLARVKQGKAA